MSHRAKTSRVFLVEPSPKFDIQDALRFGELAHLLPVSTNPLNSQGTLAFLCERFEFLEFDPEVDYLIMTGQQLMVTLAAVAGMSVFGKLKLLVFDSRSSNYIERQIVRNKECTPLLRSSSVSENSF